MTPVSPNVTPVDLANSARLRIAGTLREIYEEVLNRENVGVTDDFFDIGGHSLLAMQAAVRIEERLGVDTPVSLIFDHPIVGDLASSLASREGTSTLSAALAHVAASTPHRTTRLAPAERAMWFLDQAIGRQAAYLLSDVWELEGSLDVGALQAAFTSIVARHPALAARYRVENGEPFMDDGGNEPFAMAQHDFRHLHGAEQDRAVASITTEDAEHPFDLQREYLLRATLLHLDAHRHLLLLTQHHIASDASSQQLLRRELATYYSAFRGPAAQSRAAVARIDIWRPTPVSSARMSTLRSYWTHQLAGLPLLELPADRRRLSTWSDNGADMTFAVPPALTAQLQQLAATHGLTLQMLLLTAYGVLLGRYSGQSEFGIATFASDRHDPRLERAIGLFVNTVIVRVDVSGAPTLLAVMGRIRRASLDAYDHRDYPFDALVSQLRPDRQSGPNPLTPAAFQFLPMADDPPALEGLTVRSRPCPTRHIRFDLEFTVRPDADGLGVFVGYSTDLFDRETIARLTRHYHRLLESFVATPDAIVSELPVLADADRREQLHEWSGAAVEGTRANVIALFDAQVARTPDASAISDGQQRVTYRGLDAWSNGIAAELSAAGVHSGDVVAIHAERSVELIAAMLGTLKVGAAYMPLDPSHPAERLAFIMRDARSSVLLSAMIPPSALSDVAQSVVRITRDAAPTQSTKSERPTPAVSADRVAYVMYTSGSTGRPKGVAVPHRGITRLVRDTNYVRFAEDDVVACVSNPAFDAATFEIWGALLNGARLVLFDRDTLLSPQRLGSALKLDGVTVMFLTAALFRQIVATAPGIFGALRYLIVGGEVVDPTAAGAVLASAPPQHLVNGYGPTENTTFSATFDITPSVSGARSIPIGRPITGSTCYVLDEHLALIPVGALGELYVGGAGVALGYVNQPALTHERFVEHPFIDGERLYRTGDRVRWRSDGHLEFLGRVDRQVKLRGHRIELEEIEHVLASHPAVTTCAVTTDARANGELRLVAYAAGSSGQKPSVDALRRYLQQQLPAFMVPELLIALDVMPLTPNGKVNRAALPSAATVRPETTVKATPLTPAELVVGRIIAHVLERDHVPSDESFFDLGGDSFRALQLATALSAELQRSVPVSMIFDHPTVTRLAAALTVESATAVSGSIVEVRRGGTKPPLYFPPGVLGEVVLNDAFIQELPEDVPLHALRGTPHDMTDSGTLAPSMEAMAVRFCAEITAFQPKGPLSLAGYSFGGLLAYEMARQLSAVGREITVLAIFDTGPDFSRGGSLKDKVTRVGLCLANLPRWVAEDVIRTIGRDTPGRLWRSSRKLARSLLTRRDMSAATPGSFAKVEHLFDVSGWSPALYAHVQNNLRIIGSFRFGPYNGRVTLFRARVRPLFHAHTWDLGWQAVARDVRVIEAPGNHHTLMHDHIRVLAQLLRAALTQP